MNKLLKNPVVLLRGVVSALYVILGVYLFFNLYFLHFIQKNYRPLLAGVILAYGLYRLYRFYVEYKDLPNE